MNTVESLSQLLALVHRPGVTDVVYVRGSDAYYRHLNPGEAVVNGTTVLQAADGGVWSKRVESTGGGGSGAVLSGTDAPTADPGVADAEYTRWNADHTAIAGKYSWDFVTGTWIASLGAAIALLLCTLTGLAQSIKFNALTTNALDAITSPLGLGLLAADDATAAQALLGLNVTEVGTITDGTVVTADLAAAEATKLTGAGLGFLTYTNTTWSSVAEVCSSCDYWVSTSPNRTTYTGYGFKCLTAGLTAFNAVRIPILGADPAVTVDRILVEIRDGVDAVSTAPSTLLASGHVQLRSDVHDWTNVVVLLDATITPGATPLFIGYKAMDASGTLVNIGATRANVGHPNVTSLNRNFRFSAGAWSLYGTAQYFEADLIMLTGGARTQVAALRATAQPESYNAETRNTTSLASTIAAITQVSGTVTTINTITNNGSLSGAASIAGWGYKFWAGRVGAASFNAIRIPWLGRYTDPSRTKDRDRVYVQIRKAAGTGTDAPTELLASGVSYVDPSLDIIQDVTVLLTNPRTGALMTVATNDLSEVSFVGYAAMNSDGTATQAMRGEGASPEYAGNSFYVTVAGRPSGQARNDDWSHFSVNPTVVQFASIGTPSQSLVGAVRRDAAMRTLGTAKSLATPDILYAVAGREFNVYFQGMVDNYRRYDWDVTTSAAALGAHLNECYRLTPADGTDRTLGFLAIDPYSGALAGTNSASLKVAAATAGTGAKNLLLIGDSTGDGPLGHLQTLDAADANLDITLVGTRGSFHTESVSGASYNFHYSDSGSAFTDGAATFDFQYFLTTYSIATPHVVVINLGINDVGGLGSSGSTGTMAYNDSTVIEASRKSRWQAEGMIASIHAVDPTIKVVICLTTMPAFDQDADGAGHNADQAHWRRQRNMWLHALNFRSAFAGRTAEQVYLLGLNVAVDTEHNVPLAASAPWNAHAAGSTTRMSNAEHLADSPSNGYRQVAEAYWACLKNLFE